VKIENSFEVAASPEAAWELLMDVPRVIPCMPGAELTETVDDSHWKARVAVKLGPIALTFLADVTRQEADEAARRAVLSASAREARGRGSARATIESSLTPLDSGTRVDLVTDLALTGAVAQYGRGMVNSVATQIVSDFAACLQSELAAADRAETASPQGVEEAAAPTAQAAPSVVSGLELTARALRASLERRVGPIDRDRVERAVHRMRAEMRKRTGI
jgi:carbon monoxide dehydrogenase subunit G